MSHTEKILLGRNHFRRSCNNGIKLLTFPSIPEDVTPNIELAATFALNTTDLFQQHLVKEKPPGVITIDDPVSRAPNLLGRERLLKVCHY